MQLSLKGKRNYLTGADIINFALSKIINKKKIIFNFYRFSKKQLEIKKLKTNTKVEKNSIIASISHSNKKYFLYIVEKKKSIKKKILFDEVNLVKNSFIKKKNITLDQNLYNFFDTIVALNKKLLNKTVIKNKWVFCKLEIKQVNNLKFKKIKIEIKDSIKKKFYRSSIYLDNKLLGFIHFVKQ